VFRIQISITTYINKVSIKIEMSPRKKKINLFFLPQFKNNYKTSSIHRKWIIECTFWSKNQTHFQKTLWWYGNKLYTQKSLKNILNISFKGQNFFPPFFFKYRLRVNFSFLFNCRFGILKVRFVNYTFCQSLVSFSLFGYSYLSQ